MGWSELHAVRVFSSPSTDADNNHFVHPACRFVGVRLLNGIAKRGGRWRDWLVTILMRGCISRVSSIVSRHDQRMELTMCRVSGSSASERCWNGDSRLVF